MYEKFDVNYVYQTVPIGFIGAQTVWKGAVLVPLRQDIPPPPPVPSPSQDILSREGSGSVLTEERRIIQASNHSTALKSAIKVALIYMVVALLWIFLSDAVVDLIPSTDVRSQIQTFKGSLFVLTSGCLILLLTWNSTRKIYAAQKAERQASARLFGVLQSVGDCIWEFDLKARQIILDHRFADLSGYPPHVAMNPEQWRRLLHPSDLKTFDQAVQRCAKGLSMEMDCSVRLHHRSGQWRTLRVRGGVLERDTEGRAILMSGALSDISEITENEHRLSRLVNELTRSETELQRFAFATAHDLRQPLRQMASYSQLANRRLSDLANPQGDPKAHQQAHEDMTSYLGFVSEGAGRMSELLDSILTNFEQRSRSLSLSDVDMLSVVDSVLEKMQDDIASANAEIICEALPMIRADGPNLAVVMEHLLRNALIYRDPSRKLKVVIGAERRLGSWEISLSDNGRGFPPDKAEDLFKAFYRLHAASEIPGTGMGLSMCRQIIEQHGGTLTARGREGQGAIFYIELPDSLERNSPKAQRLDKTG
jgi:PAS domain S-box-containing protein